MKELEKKLEILEYHIQLLLEMSDQTKFPFYQLIIRSRLTKEEVQHIYKLCEKLTEEYKEQKAQGLLYYTDLLTLFAGQLSEKLDVNETIEAMYNQGLYKPLMTEFKRLISHFPHARK